MSREATEEQEDPVIHHIKNDTAKLRRRSSEFWDHVGYVFT